MVVVAMLCCSASEISARTPSKLFKKAEKAIVDGINYSLDAKNNKAKVLAGKNLYTGDLVIPEKFTEDSVTYYVEEIDGGAFKDSPTLTSVVIPTTVTKIAIATMPQRHSNGCSFRFGCQKKKNSTAIMRKS